MLWILLANLAAFVWAVSNIFDEFLIHTEQRRASTLLAINGLQALVVAVVTYGSGTVTPVAVDVLALGIGAGALGGIAFYPYFRALESTPASSAVIMWNAAPVLVAILAIPLLGERLSLQSCVAGTLLVASATMVSAAAVRTNPTSSAGVRWMMLASVAVALEAVAQKSLFQRVDFSTGIFLLSIGAAAVGLVLLASSRPTRIQLRETATSRSGALVLLNESLNSAGVYLSGLAVSLGPVSLVKAIGGMQPMYVMLLAIGLKRLRIASIPTLPRARSSWRNGFAAAAIAVLGLALLGAGE